MFVFLKFTQIFEDTFGEADWKVQMFKQPYVALLSATVAFCNKESYSIWKGSALCQTWPDKTSMVGNRWNFTSCRVCEKNEMVCCIFNFRFFPNPQLYLPFICIKNNNKIKSQISFNCCNEKYACLELWRSIPHVLAKNKMYFWEIQFLYMYLSLRKSNHYC